MQRYKSLGNLRFDYEYEIEYDYELSIYTVIYLNCKVDHNAAGPRAAMIFSS